MVIANELAANVQREWLEKFRAALNEAQTTERPEEISELVWNVWIIQLEEKISEIESELAEYEKGK